MTKDEAHKHVVKLWRALPPLERQTLDQATAFAGLIDAGVDFHTMGNKTRVIAAWLQRDVMDVAAAVERARLRSQTVKASA